MSDELSFRCPVCRASQALNEECRRCQADLSLVVRAHRRLLYVNQRLREAIESGDQDRERSLQDELRWLAPAR